jgi:ERCC4-type nuclease
MLKLLLSNNPKQGVSVILSISKREHSKSKMLEGSLRSEKKFKSASAKAVQIIAFAFLLQTTLNNNN